MILSVDPNNNSTVTESMRFSMLGTERMRIDSSGNVGIGTGSPASNLHISSLTEAKVTIQGDSNNDGGEEAALLEFKTDGNAVAHTIGIEQGTSNDLVIDSGNGSLSTVSNALVFKTKPTGTTTTVERMRIDSSGVVTFKAGITEDAVTLTGTSTTIDLATATNFLHDLTGATTYTFSNPSSTGNATAFTLKIIQDSTARAITWPSSVDWAGGTAPTLTATNNGVDVFVFYTIDGGTTYYGFTAGQAMA